MGNCERPISAGGDGRREGAPLPCGFLMRTGHVQALLRPRHLRARFAHRAGGGRRRLHAVRLDFKTNQQNSPEYLAINPKGRVPALVTDQGILTETPAMLAFIAQSFPLGQAGAARRRLCVRAGAGLQQLSLFHRACRACPQGARLSLGDRGTIFRRHEAHGAEDHGRLLFADRARHAEGAVGDGRAVHDLRSAICTRSRVWLEGDSVDLATLPKVADHRSAWRSGRRCRRCWPRRRPECKRGVVPALSRILIEAARLTTHNPQGVVFAHAEATARTIYESRWL